MVKRCIRNLHSDRPVQPRWCDVVIDKERNRVYLARKDKRKNLIEVIPWEDVKYQVEAFIEEQMELA